MSIRYTVDHCEALVTVVIDERATPSDLLSHFEAIASDDDAREFDRLVILREGGIKSFSQGDIAEVAERADQLWGDRAGFRIAIVAAMPVQFGLSRMYSLCSARSSEKQAVFHSVQEARSWLGRQGPSADAPAPVPLAAC